MNQQDYAARDEIRRSHNFFLYSAISRSNSSRHSCRPTNHERPFSPRVGAKPSSSPCRAASSTERLCRKAGTTSPSLFPIQKGLWHDGDDVATSRVLGSRAIRAGRPLRRRLLEVKREPEKKIVCPPRPTQLRRRKAQGPRITRDRTSRLVSAEDGYAA